MKVGDLVKRRHWVPETIGVITAILCEDEHRVHEVEVFVDSSQEEWEADEVEVL